MRLDGITIALRARPAWEAVDLGVALVRAHAVRIYAAWLLVTLPVFVLVNGACWLLGTMWPATLILWWLKPAFDRIPLFVASRAVFGEAPSLRETLRAQSSMGWRAVAAWLTWRRLHPGRAMLLAVDLLEAPRGEARSRRIGALMRRDSAPNIMLTIVGVHMETIFGFSVWMLALMFVPVEFFSDSARAIWDNLFLEPPPWGSALVNFVAWTAMTLVEPFYVGAGFGLYLNRRVQLEGWDIELAFRRLAARLAQPSAAMLIAVVCLWPAQPARAAEQAKTQAVAAEAKPGETPAAKEKTRSLEALFGEEYRKDDAEFLAAVKQAYLGEDLNPKQKIGSWKARRSSESAKTKPGEIPAGVRLLGNGIAFFMQYALWILAAVVLVVVLLNLPRWLPWIGERYRRERERDEPDEIGVRVVAAAAALPDDLPAAVRALWASGRLREALALLYRAAVANLAERLGSPLPPGATESECLRHARRLGEDHYARLFTRIVRCWQAAAYAQRLPKQEDVEDLLAAWPAAAAPKGGTA